MSKILLSFVLFFKVALSNSEIAFWDYSHTYNLKKDEVAKILIKKTYQNSYEKEGEFEFRWTLFNNKGLVTLVKYEGFPTQYVLYQDMYRQGVKFKLIPDKDYLKDMVYLVLKFSKFDDKNAVASLDVLIKDASKRVEVEFVNKGE